MTEKDHDATITILCSEKFKQKIKTTISQKGIKRFNEGYLMIMELGLKNFKEMEV